MIRPTLAEARNCGKGYTMMPIAMELYADVKTSIEILRNLREKSNRFCILESVMNDESWGRYSFLGYDPAMTVRGTAEGLCARSGGKTEQKTGNPIRLLRELLAQHQSPRIEGLPPFTGGFVGCFSYECIRHFEPSLKLQAKNPENFADFELMLMDRVIAFDHFQQKIFLIVNVPTATLESSYIQGLTVLKDMKQTVLENRPAQRAASGCCGPFEPVFTEETWCRMVETVKRHIVEGDIFQAVISNRLTAPFTGDLLETYRALRTSNPSPYMVYFRFGDMEIAGASPETLISLRDGKLNTFPLAGTCPRGRDARQDARLEAALLADEKELAEHDMLVDLGRNDLGRVSRFGSVKVDVYRTIKRFSHVSHIASVVTGDIRPDCDALDALAATLPAGTLSGAPKKRACEIIDAVEGLRRGPYGGAMGYIDFTGNMDLCIGIRMAVLKNGRVFVQSGGGIVADSVPKKEYQETIHKAQAVLLALQAGKAGIS